jgi:DNA polymerase-3 subunit epsilon
MDYVVLDLETANPDYASICQIGYVIVRNGEIADQQSILVDPDDYFDPWNIAIHGITADHVKGAPRFNAIHGALAETLAGSVVVHHGPFDRIALGRACDLCGLDGIAARWLDNQTVVRRTWTDFARSGYALKKLARHFSIQFSHHDALEDARVTEIIFRRALHESGFSPDDWLVRSKQPISPQVTLSREGAANGPYDGESIVFTGALSVPRSKAADFAHENGFSVENSVSKRTTVLCVGIQNRDRLIGYSKSSKHRKAEQMIQAGHDISIISEPDFWAMIKRPVEPA